ncbi:MAG: sigma 54-interacting transcriptional regulator [Clostridiales bacterium]
MKDILNELAIANVKIKELEAIIKDKSLEQDQYNDILYNMSEAVERDLPDYTISYVNRAFCDFYGVTKEEVVGINGMEWIVAQDRVNVHNIIKAATPQNPCYNYTCRIRKKNNEIVWIEVYGRNFFDEDGNLLVSQDVSRDITEYKKAAIVAENSRMVMEDKVRIRTLELEKSNHALQETNSYLQSTLNNITEGVISIDSHKNIRFLNYGTNTSWNKSENTIIEKIKEDIDDENSHIYHLLYGERSFQNVEITFPAKPKGIQCLASGVCLEKDDNIRKGLLVLRPIDEVKRLVNKFSGAQARFTFPDIIGNSEEIKSTIAFAEKMSQSEGSIVIEGESGTGKELFAQSIHNSSMRKSGPFVAVNCGAIPRDLIGSELFGYVEGAFTGAKKGGKPGKFELASGGTIFLDEISEMPLEQQIALLRVIQERNVVRIGDIQVIPVNVRLICATNKNLLSQVHAGNFREDLYYRLNVINLQIPPLRKRLGDISILFNHFIEELCRNHNTPNKKIDKGVFDYLSEYEWPGNVRELQNITERMFFLSDENTVKTSDIPEYIRFKEKTNAPIFKVEDLDETNTIVEKNNSIASQRKIEKIEKEEEERLYILSLLNRHNGNITHAAKEMGISRTAFYRKLEKYTMK